MRRHSWSSTGRKADSPDDIAQFADSAFDVEVCRHCRTERVADRGYRSLFLYRGGEAIAGRRSIPPDRWCGYTVIPKCVERP